MFIVDVLRYDIEQISSVLNLLNSEGCIGWREFWPRDFRFDEVATELIALVESGLVERLEVAEDKYELVPLARSMDPALMDQLWFRITKRGWQAWGTWDAPISPEDEISLG